SLSRGRGRHGRESTAESPHAIAGGRGRRGDARASQAFGADGPHQRHERDDGLLEPLSIAKRRGEDDGRLRAQGCSAPQGVEYGVAALAHERQVERAVVIVEALTVEDRGEPT